MTVLIENALVGNWQDTLVGVGQVVLLGPSIDPTRGADVGIGSRAAVHGVSGADGLPSAAEG